MYQDQRRHWITTVSKQRFHTHRGYVDLGQLAGMHYGETIKTSQGHSLSVFKPRLMDMVESFDRPTQILYPKDIAYAIYQMGIQSGDSVLEVGTGSGAMTVSLAKTVWPDGKVYTYEARPDFFEIAKGNIQKSKVGRVVEQYQKDPSSGFDQTDVSAAVIDVGDPWKMVSPAFRALTPGGVISAFTPTTNQLEKLVGSLRETGFLVLESIELILREIRGESGRVRPETRMIGHTAYITIARKIGNTEITRKELDG